MHRYLILAAFLSFGCSASSQRTPEPLPADLDFPVGAFTLVERSGKTVTDADLKGKVWVASFIFTRCSGPCPHVSATMARLQAELPKREDLRLVTFTIDPEHDTPTVLTNYAANFNADAQRWLFLTGPEKDIHTLLTQQFKQAVEKNTSKDAKAGEEFFHSSRLAVVDRKGTIRAVFDGKPTDNRPDAAELHDANLARLKATVSRLLDE